MDVIKVQIEFGAQDQIATKDFFFIIFYTKNLLLGKINFLLTVFKNILFLKIQHIYMKNINDWSSFGSESQKNGLH